MGYIVLMQDIEINENQNVIIKELKQLVKSKIAGFAVPDEIQICSGLPKTRSGKIMRRILRKVTMGKYDELGDISTLADPSVVKLIVDEHASMTKKRMTAAS